MQEQAQVWNDFSKEHVEMFKGDEIRIPAKSFINMNWSDAVQFRGQYTPIIRDGLGNDLKPKMIRLVRVEAVVEEPKDFTCQMDGKSFANQAELDKHIAENHTESMVDADAKKKLLAKK